MIAPARKCGCYDKSDFTISENITNGYSLISPDNSIKDLEKCVCPKKNEAGYKKLNGTCDICCKGTKNEYINQDLIQEEKKSKVFSEIVEKGLPYKETEIIINDNRMIIRVQKDSKTKEEWDPPCDCNEKNKPIRNTENTRNDISFRKVDLNRSHCRTVTVYPQADSDVHTELNVDKSNNELENNVKVMKEKTTDLSKIERQKKEEIMKSIDLEENPNIFLLRIKKRCESQEGKYNIDLEFRTPRPWLTKPIVDKPPPLPPIDSKVTVDNDEEEKERKKDKEETRKKIKTKKGGKKKKKQKKNN